MDEVWERAVETALDGQSDYMSTRSLTLDGAVKCLHGRLPPPSLLEKFQSLEHLSIANIGVSSLEKFPRLRKLQKLILSDNRIAGGLEFLVEAGLESLRDLDLSNNRIQYLEDLRPLAQLRLVSLDLYECPVTRIKDYRSKVFGMIKSLKYLDKMDADENERPESDEEEEDEEDDDDEDPGSGEVDGDNRSGKLANGSEAGGIVDADEDDESDADEEPEVTPGNNGFSRNTQQPANGFRVAAARDEDEDEDDVEDEEDDDLGEEIDEEDGEEEDVVEVHEIDDSEEDEDGIEEDDEDDDDEEEEDVDDEEDDGEVGSTGRITSTEGEIDGHEQGEEQGDEDENGEIGEEDGQEIEEDGEYEDGEGEDEEEDMGSDFRVQPIRGPVVDVGGSDVDAENEEDVEDEEVEDDDEPDGFQMLQASPSQQKRKRDAEDGGTVEHERSSKRQ